VLKHLSKCLQLCLKHMAKCLPRVWLYMYNPCTAVIYLIPTEKYVLPGEKITEKYHMTSIPMKHCVSLQ